MGLDDVALLIHIIMADIVTKPTSTGQAEGNIHWILMIIYFYCLK